MKLLWYKKDTVGTKKKKKNYIQPWEFFWQFSQQVEEEQTNFLCECVSFYTKLDCCTVTTFPFLFFQFIWVRAVGSYNQCIMLIKIFSE